MARIGTKVYVSETVPSVTMLPGYRTGSLVWLTLDSDTFTGAIVQKAVLDKNGCVVKYKLWLGSDWLTEADEGQLVQSTQCGLFRQRYCSWRVCMTPCITATLSQTSCLATADLCYASTLSCAATDAAVKMEDKLTTNSPASLEMTEE